MSYNNESESENESKNENNFKPTTTNELIQPQEQINSEAYNSTFKNLPKTPEKKIEKAVAHIDVFPELDHIFIGNDNFTEDDIIKNFVDKTDDQKTVIAFMKKVFQRQYPITRSNGLPKIPSLEHDRKLLLKVFTFYFNKLRNELMQQKQKYGNSVSLRERVDHIQKIHILMEHFQDDNEKFPYHLFQDYIENIKFVKFEDDLVDALNKVKDVENEDVRIRNLLRQFAKLYLTTPANDEYDLRDPGVSTEEYGDFSKSLNKRVPDVLLHLMRVLEGEKGEGTKGEGENQDLSQLYELLERLGKQVDDIDNYSSGEIVMIGGAEESKKKIEEAIEEVFTKIIEKYKDLKNNCAPKEQEIQAHRAMLSKKDIDILKHKADIDAKEGIISEQNESYKSLAEKLQDKKRKIARMTERISEDKKEKEILHRQLKHIDKDILIKENEFNNNLSLKEKEIHHLNNKLESKLRKLAEKDITIKELVEAAVSN